MVESADYDLMRFAQNHKAQRGCYVGETWVHLRGLIKGVPVMMTQDEACILLHCRYQWADRQDARLMSAAQRLRRSGGRDCTLLLGPVLCGGALERFTGLDELEQFI